MTTTDHEPRTENDALIETAKDATTPHLLGGAEEGRFYVVRDGDSFQTIDLEAERQHLADHPRRKTGALTVRDAESFTRYLDRHAADHTEVWADRERSAILAVINGHATTLAGHGDHRATLALRKTPAWTTWERLNGKQVGQAQFAEHIEDRQIDIVEPKPADMLEVVQTFKAAKKVDFESSQRLSSGEVVLEYRETLNATAGKKGQLTIPERFTLALQPYEGSGAYRVTARLRYRINDGVLSIGYALDRPEDVLEQAFNDVVTEVEAGITAPLFHGWPA